MCQGNFDMSFPFQKLPKYMSCVYDIQNNITYMPDDDT